MQTAGVDFPRVRQRHIAFSYSSGLTGTLEPGPRTTSLITSELRKEVTQFTVPCFWLSPWRRLRRAPLLKREGLPGGSILPIKLMAAALRKDWGLFRKSKLWDSKSLTSWVLLVLTCKAKEGVVLTRSWGWGALGMLLILSPCPQSPLFCLHPVEGAWTYSLRHPHPSNKADLVGRSQREFCSFIPTW